MRNFQYQLKIWSTCFARWNSFVTRTMIFSLIQNESYVQNYWKILNPELPLSILFPPKICNNQFIQFQKISRSLKLMKNLRSGSKKILKYYSQEKQIFSYLGHNLQAEFKLMISSDLELTFINSWKFHPLRLNTFPRFFFGKKVNLGNFNFNIHTLFIFRYV